MSAGGAGDDVLGLVGQNVDGQLLVESFVGAGRATCVYRARHLVLEEPVALQCATVTSLEAIDRARQSFADAVRLHYRLERKTLHVAKVMSHGQLSAPRRTRGGEQVPYLVREWFPGGALAQHLTDRRTRGLGGRSLVEVMTLLAPVARALSLAHGEGIVHLAVNPRTVLLPGDDPAQAKLAEFGFAGSRVRALRPPLAAYAAPEQLVDPRDATEDTLLTAAADVYSLALLVLEMVRDLPVHAIDASREDVAQATGQAGRRAADPVFPGEARVVLARALSFDPGKRPPDVSTFWTELTVAARDMPSISQIFVATRNAPVAAEDWDPDAVTAPTIPAPGAQADNTEPTLRTGPAATPSFDALAASQNKGDGASVDIDMTSAPSLPIAPRAAGVPAPRAMPPSTPSLDRPSSAETTVRIFRQGRAREVLVAVASFLVVSAVGFAAVFFLGDSHASPAGRSPTAPTTSSASSADPQPSSAPIRQESTP
jgi:serine/threonine protein kinase